MFLSTVAGSSAQRRVDWADYGSLHRFVMTRFGDLGSSDSPRSRGGVLFRAEAVSGRRRLLIQSVVAPIGVDQCIDISPTLDGLMPGTRCRMRLDVNPVQRVSRSGADRALPEADVPEWLAGKLEGALSLDQLVDLRIDIRRVHRKKIVVAEADAVVTVTDASRMRDLVVGGVGRRKSHGCGLVSLLPIELS